MISEEFPNYRPSKEPPAAPNVLLRAVAVAYHRLQTGAVGRIDADDDPLRAQDSHVIAYMGILNGNKLSDPLAPEEIDADHSPLGVQAGVIDLKSGAFRPARQEDYTTGENTFI
jgi:D5 N terminal like